MLRYCFRILQRTRARGSPACIPRQRPRNRVKVRVASKLRKRSREGHSTFARSFFEFVAPGGGGHKEINERQPPSLPSFRLRLNFGVPKRSSQCAWLENCPAR